MVVCMDVSLLFSSDKNGCFRVTRMVVCMDVSLLFSNDNNGSIYGCVIVVFE